MRFISIVRLCILCIIFTCSTAVAIVLFEDDWEHYGDVYNSLGEHTENNFFNYKDFLREDDSGEFELADVMSLSKSKVNRSMDVYSKSELLTIVDIHNIYRSNLTKPIPKGSDVMYVTWNKTLASAAEDWLKKCEMKNGIGGHDNITEQRGQNMYIGTSMLPSRPLYLWYQEYKNYFFQNFSCKKPYPKYQCTHMTQLLWFDSAEIGCARRSYCYPKEPSYKLVHCYYYQPGNLHAPGMQVFKYGLQCTRCDQPDGNLCLHGLCISKKMCTAHKLDCECKFDCKNCVKPNYKTCRCGSCKDGWDWPDCSHPCTNAFDTLRKKPGFCKWQLKIKPKKICENKEVLTACRKECGACKPLNLKKKGNLCCEGKTCPAYHKLDKSCNCVEDCPSNICLFPPSTTTEPPAFFNVTSTNDTGDSEKKFPTEKKAKVPSRSISRTTSALNNLVSIALSIFVLRVLNC